MRTLTGLPGEYWTFDQKVQKCSGGTLQTRTFLAPFGYEEIKVVHGGEEDLSAGRLIIPKFPEGAKTEKQGPSNSKDTSEGDDGQGGSRRSEEPMQQDTDQVEKKDEPLVSLPWNTVMLRYFEEEMRTKPKIHALIAIPYVRTELQLRFAWCMIGLTRGEYDSEETKRSKGEKVFLLTSVRNLMAQEGAAVACAKRRDALCFVRFM